MEQRFGQDFSRVRLYTDQQAATAASVKARAFSVGSQVPIFINLILKADPQRSRTFD